MEGQKEYKEKIRYAVVYRYNKKQHTGYRLLAICDAKQTAESKMKQMSKDFKIDSLQISVEPFMVCKTRNKNKKQIKREI